MPADIEPSPITAMTLLSPPARSRATAMPRPAEIEVEEWAAPKGSYSLSERLVKPDRPSALAQRLHAVAPSGQDLVRIGLMADIPDDAVLRRVEDIMQGDGQFDHAEAGAEMAAGDGYGVNGGAADVLGHGAQIALGQSAQVGGDFHLVQQGGRRIIVHSALDPRRSGMTGNRRGALHVTCAVGKQKRRASPSKAERLRVNTWTPGLDVRSCGGFDPARRNFWARRGRSRQEPKIPEARLSGNKNVEPFRRGA